MISLEKSFDSVVMLTWSDWHTEPRSNRYHYAVRFSRIWPVFFVQVDGSGDTVTFEKLGNYNITIVHIAPDYGPAQAARLAAVLRERGVARPLVWFYNLYMADAIARLHPATVVYHATEDYVAKADSVSITQIDMSNMAIAAIKRADFVVAVSEGVAKTHRPVSDRPVLVLPNGCDFAFWEETRAANYESSGVGKVALFQGGINARLDFVLLARLTEICPDWKFWFCGKSVDGGADWERLRQHSNVRYFGQLDSAGIADLARQARVGLIPFKDSDLMRRSLPLKAYEYLACGLPVVTTPVDALEQEPELFSTASTAEAFAVALSKLEGTRDDPKMVARRLNAAAAASYDAHFESLLGHLRQVVERLARQRPSLNVLMLYDDRSTHVSTISEHLEAFRRHSLHRFHFLPATQFVGIADDPRWRLDLSCYDAIMIHYSVRVSVQGHLSPGISAAIAAYRGPKLLFAQDEYDHVEMTRGWMERLGIDALFTNVPLDSVGVIYPKSRFSHIDFMPTLTGYVPEDASIDSFGLPMNERHLRIAYRGRVLPHHYGALAREKYAIGVEMRRRAEARGLPIDIEVEEHKRIYGDDWYRFIGSARATLGTESGSNVFDMDGSLARLADQHRDMPFEEFADTHLKTHEGLVRMNQISPKIFEAIRLRTALVLFEGEYSGVVRPDEHFIPLKKDYSNVDSVFARLEDISFLEQMTSRAYRDVIGSGRYSLRSFVAGVDEYLSHRALGRRRASIISVPLAAIYGGEDADLLLRLRPDAMLLNDAVLPAKVGRAQMLAIGQVLTDAAGGGLDVPSMAIDLRGVQEAPQQGIVYRALRVIWRALPKSARSGVLRCARAILAEDGVSSGPLTGAARRMWRAVRPSGASIVRLRRQK